MTQRSFPLPWTVEQMPGGYKVLDANGRSLAYVYGRETKANADTPMHPLAHWPIVVKAEMKRDRDLESILTLSERLSDPCQKYCRNESKAEPLCDSYCERGQRADEAQGVAEEISAKLDEAMRAYWIAKHPH
jgi:hypothetical protein